MESDLKTLSVVLKNTLPFMNAKFFERIAQTFPSNIVLKDTKIFYKDFLPSIIK